jgi:hypothetical protein
MKINHEAHGEHEVWKIEDRRWRIEDSQAAIFNLQSSLLNLPFLRALRELCGWLSDEL